MTNYAYLDKILHQQFLGDTPISKFLFDRLIKKGKLIKNKPQENKHVFITGLARSGTTAILNDIYSTNQFASFLYKHMPFILSPRIACLATKLNNNKPILKERFHKDGIMLSTESPECLDEVFWIKSDENYFSKNLSTDFSIDEKYLNAYDYLLSCFTKYQNKNRLLVKNNNNHIRLSTLSKYFTNSIFFIIFRDPIYQSLSLLNMHKRFTKLQNKDKYILDYMNLIGHREFGKGARKFSYDNKVIKKNKKFHINTINYWLEQWINCYSWLLKKKLFLQKNIYFVSYEKVCRDDEYLNNLYSILKISKNNPTILDLKNKELDFCEYEIDTSLKEMSYKIYEEMSNLPFEK